ncbi:MAG: ATP phosphoribosyltransferase [Duncaniella sp.]|nr:ATP phosphoribosyltransferase [Muribaculum sp.]MCM1255774.1 ATP phosphoribosyltransferase [Duncaniella sp.]
MLRIAIQAKGRLNEKTMALLADAGISASVGSRSLIAHAKGFPVDLLLLRDDDIPQAVAMGTADIGIVGLNEVEEKCVNVQNVMNLGFGGCRLSLAVPREADYKGLEWFNGKRIATSYPAILSRFLKDNSIKAEIHTITGSVEIAPAIGMADSIFDIVSSGGTLVQNGLVEVMSVLESQAVLIATPNLTEDKMEELHKLCFRFRSIIESRGMKYVLMNIPKASLEEALSILPSMKSPTVLHLADPNWLSLHAVIPESQLWEKIEKLKSIGAEDILVLVLENIVK